MHLCPNINEGAFKKSANTSKPSKLIENIQKLAFGTSWELSGSVLALPDMISTIFVEIRWFYHKQTLNALIWIDLAPIWSDLVPSSIIGRRLKPASQTSCFLRKVRALSSTAPSGDTVPQALQSESESSESYEFELEGSEGAGVGGAAGASGVGAIEELLLDDSPSESLPSASGEAGPRPRPPRLPDAPLA